MLRGPCCRTVLRGPCCRTVLRGPCCRNMLRGPCCRNVLRGPCCRNVAGLRLLLLLYCYKHPFQRKEISENGQVTRDTGVKTVSWTLVAKLSSHGYELLTVFVKSALFFLSKLFTKEKEELLSTSDQSESRIRITF